MTVKFSYQVFLKVYEGINLSQEFPFLRFMVQYCQTTTRAIKLLEMPGIVLVLVHNLDGNKIGWFDPGLQESWFGQELVHR